MRLFKKTVLKWKEPGLRHRAIREFDFIDRTKRVWGFMVAIFAFMTLPFCVPIFFITERSTGEILRVVAIVSSVIVAMITIAIIADYNHWSTSTTVWIHPDGISYSADGIKTYRSYTDYETFSFRRLQVKDQEVDILMIQKGEQGFEFFELSENVTPEQIHQALHDHLRFRTDQQHIKIRLVETKDNMHYEEVIT